MALREHSARIGRPPSYTPELHDEAVQEWRSIKRQQQTRLKSDEVDQLVASYQAGASCRELATEFGVNETTVRSHLSRRDVPRSPSRKIHSQLLDEAVRLYENGESLRTVGRAIGAAPDTVRLALIAAGVTIRSRGSRKR